MTSMTFQQARVHIPYNETAGFPFDGHHVQNLMPRKDRDGASSHLSHQRLIGS